MNLQCTSGSRSFAKELRALKMRSIVTCQWKVTTINWGESSKLILLQLHKKLLKNPVLTILWSFSIWSKLEKWKSSISRYLMSWPQVKKKKTVILKCHFLLFYATKTNHFLTGLWHSMNSGFHDNQQWSVQWLDWEEMLQSTSHSQTCAKRCHGNCFVMCCLSDSLQLSECWRNHYFWVMCSANQWDALKTVSPAVDIGQQNVTNSLQHPTAHHTIKNWTNFCLIPSFASSAIYTWPLASQLPILQASQQLFAVKMFPQPAENAFQESLTP